MITKEEYEEARAAIDNAITQLEPDGRLCAICGDNDHQAWECRFNPVRAMKRLERLERFINEVHESIHHNTGI